jgi:SAM-dependent methyltransferase
VVTPDGCPVKAYAALPAEPDLSTVMAYVRGRTKVLDLGAGTGRIADPLAAAGYDVLAVDESAEMLAHVRRARSIQVRIEDLVSTERFDAVLMLSHLINVPTDAQREALLTTAVRHLGPEGVLLAQRHDPAAILRAGRSVIGDVEVALIDVDTTRWPAVSATTQYRVGGQVWDQPWEALVLDDDATADVLDRSGLRTVSMDGSWVLAVRADRP